jgi:hypothetical protein
MVRKILALAASLVLLAGTPIAFAQDATPTTKPSKGGGGGGGKGGKGGGGTSHPNPLQYFIGNYAGYEVAAPLVSHVSGSWVVPTPDCSTLGVNQTSAVFIWLGLGGDGPAGTLEQIGTVIFCNESPGSGASAVTKIEFYPQAAQPLTDFDSSQKFPVSTGDKMTASVNYVGQDRATNNALFTFSMTNITQGWTFQPAAMTLPTHPPLTDLTSAEWAAESCCVAFVTLYPLLPFGSINFTSADATESLAGGKGAQEGSINFFPYDDNELCANDTANGQTVLTTAIPGPVSSDGRSFSILWGDTAVDMLQGVYPGMVFHCH